MKKIFTIALVAGLLVMASCSDKEPTNTASETVFTYNYVTTLDDSAQPVIKKGNYTFGFDFVNNDVNIATDRVDLGNNEEIKFTTEKFKFTNSVVLGFNEKPQTVLHGSDPAPCFADNGMKITDLRFELSPIFNIPPQLSYTKDPESQLPQPDLSYTARAGSAPTLRYVVGDLYKIYTFWPDLYYCGATDTEVINVPGNEFRSQDIGYRIKFDIAKKKAQVVLYNVQFNPNMPKMECLILPDLDVQFTNNGYIIEATNINPLYIEGEKIMENPRFPFTSFKFVAEGNMVTGKCDFTVAGRFHGSFEGEYMTLVLR